MKIIITENQLMNLKIRRNLEELPKFIKSTYKWLNPKTFKNFDEFLERVVFSTTRDFVSSFMNEGDDYENLKTTLKPLVEDIIMKEYYDEILNYFTNHP